MSAVDAVLPLINLLSEAGKVALLQALTQSLVSDIHYVVYNVRYTYRLCSDDQVSKILTAMKDNDMESELLYIWNDRDEEPYFNVALGTGKDDTTGSLEEHPEARATFAALRGVTRPGIVVKFPQCASLLEFIHAVQECKHCAYLTPDPYNITTTYALIDGKIESVVILDFDTESG